MIISVPGKQPAVCDSLVELLDLYPTMANLCGFKAPVRLQGKDISRLLDNPNKTVRDAAFSVNGKGYLLRTAEWAYMRYGANGKNGEELFDMVNDPKQYTNLVGKDKYQQQLESLRLAMDEKLASVLDNDLELTYSTKP